MEVYEQPGRGAANMKLYYSINSPYARIIRIAIFEAGAADKIEQIEVVTRTPDNPVLAHSPLGKVPTLVTDQFVLGETLNIYLYLQEVFGKPGADWANVALGSIVMGFLDGVAVWGRESMFHPDGNASELVLDLEKERAARSLAYFEEIWTGWQGEHPWDFNHIALACALVLLGRFGGLPDWPVTHPALAAWFETVKSNPAMRATEPPAS